MYLTIFVIGGNVIAIMHQLDLEMIVLLNIHFFIVTISTILGYYYEDLVRLKVRSFYELRLFIKANYDEYFILWMIMFMSLSSIYLFYWLVIVGIFGIRFV